MDSSPGALALTRRERQVAILIANGQTTAGIAGSLSISSASVTKLERRIIERLSVLTRVQIAILALQLGLVEPQPLGQALSPRGAE